jgi:hypothetical protein
LQPPRSSTYKLAALYTPMSCLSDAASYTGSATCVAAWGVPACVCIHHTDRSLQSHKRTSLPPLRLSPPSSVLHPCQQASQAGRQHLQQQQQTHAVTMSKPAAHCLKCTYSTHHHNRSHHIHQIQVRQITTNTSGSDTALKADIAGRVKVPPV